MYIYMYEGSTAGATASTINVFNDGKYMQDVPSHLQMYRRPAARHPAEQQNSSGTWQ